MKFGFHRLSWLIGGLLFLPQIARAEGVPMITPSQPAGVPGSVEEIVSNVFTFGITIGGIIFFVLFLIAGISYLTGAGNDEQTGKAKKQMVDAIIGLVLVLGAWAIARFVSGELGLSGSSGSSSETLPTAIVSTAISKPSGSATSSKTTPAASSPATSAPSTAPSSAPSPTTGGTIGVDDLPPPPSPIHP